jgi:hypothetical protein
MSRGAHSFKQGDLTKAMKAAAKSGVKDWRIEIVPGKIIVVAAASASAPDAPDETSADLRKLL